MEKTFSDLIKPHQKIFDYYNSQRIYIDKADVLELLQQVREATAIEIMDMAEQNNIDAKFVYAIENLPTDRIKIKK